MHFQSSGSIWATVGVAPGLDSGQRHTSRVVRSRMQDQEHQALVRLALRRDRVAVRTLVDLLTPAIQARVARILLRSSRGRGRDPRQDTADLTQDVFALLFAQGGRHLLKWEPARGLSLLAFVGFVTERHCVSILRTAKRNPWTEDPTLDAGMELQDPAHFEERIESRQTLAVLFDRMIAVLSPLGRSLFQQLMVEQRPASEVCERTRMSRDAVYAWQSRLTMLLRALRNDLDTEQPTPPGLDP